METGKSERQRLKPMRRLSRWLRSFLVCVLALHLSSPTFAGDPSSPCDPRLPQVRDDPNGYRRRGDRCEGVYIREVAGNTTLLVASFTESTGRFVVSATGHISIAWAPIGGSALRLRAQALIPRRHYRMDSIRPIGETLYRWPSSLLAALSIGESDFGIVGRTMLRVGVKEREAYVPLRIGDGAAPARLRRLTVVPGEQLEELFVSLVKLNAVGDPANRYRQDEALGRSYYPAGKPIEIALPELEHAGVYRLELGATLSRGGSSTESVWILLPEDT